MNKLPLLSARDLVFATQAITLSAFLTGCIPVPSLIEGAKQLGGYAFEEALRDDQKFMRNYSDEQVCLISTNSSHEWVSENVIFLKEAKKREITKECRKKIK